MFFLSEYFLAPVDKNLTFTENFLLLPSTKGQKFIFWLFSFNGEKLREPLSLLTSAVHTGIVQR